MDQYMNYLFECPFILFMSKLFGQFGSDPVFIRIINCGSVLTFIPNFLKVPQDESFSSLIQVTGWWSQIGMGRDKYWVTRKLFWKSYLLLLLPLSGGWMHYNQMSVNTNIAAWSNIFRKFDQHKISKHTNKISRKLLV